MSLESYSSMHWEIWDFGIESLESIQNKMKSWADLKQKDFHLWYGEHALIVSKGIRSHDEKVAYWPSLNSNRGGLLTMHLPGQLVFYPLWPVLRYITLEKYLMILEDMVSRVIGDLTEYRIQTYTIKASPGVYTEQGKIASLGLRLSRDCVYHGISLNIACSLKPFESLVCCGQKEMRITSLRSMGYYGSMERVKALMTTHFFDLLEQETLHVNYYSLT